jgi:hypothetical protein
VILSVLSLKALRERLPEIRGKQEAYRRAHRHYGRWLGENTPAGEAVVLSDIGQFGYFAGTGVKVIDLAGLTDPVIARSPGGMHQKAIDPDYVLRQRPAYIVLVCRKDRGKWINRGFAAEKVLMESERFRSHYMGPFLIYYREDYSYHLYSRRDLAEQAFPSLEAWRARQAAGSFGGPGVAGDACLSEVSLAFLHMGRSLCGSL